VIHEACIVAAKNPLTSANINVDVMGNLLARRIRKLGKVRFGHHKVEP